MAKRSYYWLCALLAFPLIAPAQLQSPDLFLPHKLGATFTPHHLLVEYVRHVAENSPNVQLVEYGRTWEGRPLLLAFVSKPENLAQLEAIRENNLRRAGLLAGEPDPAFDRALVWLSFSVHGNEAAGSESAMAVLHELADPNNRRTQPWLDSTVVIIDPAINPDGYSRYTHWYRGIAPPTPNPAPETVEHREPWPGGRTNHYYFDLNRDWAWQTQQESRHRIEQYAQWLPHVHVDVHEQGYNNPYYFAPAARPYHSYITQWQRDFQYTVGKNNARYFDREGWLYFTRERFDLFYPSYGDTYPTYNGAIGMTYEQAGIGAGRAVLTDNGDTLTLYDRIRHHQTTALATVEVSARNAGALIRNFGAYYRQARNNPEGRFKSFIISGNNPPERLRAFTALLDRNHIQYGRVGRATSIRAFDYRSGGQSTIDVDRSDLVISAYQPRSVLAQILLEPEAELEDSLTYDITAWSLPYAYGLEAYASSERLFVEPDTETPTARPEFQPDAYAYLAHWRGLDNARFLSSLLNAGLTVRYATSAFTVEGQSFDPGALVITRADNRHRGELAKVLRKLAAEHRQELISVQTGFADQGPDLGSNAMVIIEKPEIALLHGEPTSAYSCGQIRYFLERDLGYPCGLLTIEALSDLEPGRYNTLILPEGYYRWEEKTLERLSDWVSAGGRLIAIGYANRYLLGRQGFELSLKPGAAPENNEEEPQLDYAGQERRDISSMIPGAIFKVNIDPTHPLAFGQSDLYFSLKTNELAFEPLNRGNNVGLLGDEDNVASGFAGYQAREKLKNTLVLGRQQRGEGDLVYWIDNPLFRAFWENGKFFFSNALFFR